MVSEHKTRLLAFNCLNNLKQGNAEISFAGDSLLEEAWVVVGARKQELALADGNTRILFASGRLEAVRVLPQMKITQKVVLSVGLVRAWQRCRLRVKQVRESYSLQCIP